MEQSIQRYFSELYDVEKKQSKEMLELFKIGKGDIAYIVSAIESENINLGILELIYKKCVIESRKFFYKASKEREWFYIEYSKKRYKIDREDVTTYVYETLYNAILSGCKEQTIRMAELFGSYAEEEKDDHCLANILLGYALKYVILDDIEHAKEYIQKLEKNKSKRGMKQFVDGHTCAFRGLIERDEEEFNKGLEFMLRHHVSRMRRNGRKLEEYFAYDSVALAMLAKDRGMNITIKHELLPEEYLKEIDIDYSAIEAIV